MKYEHGAELMMDAIRGIHGRFKKLYGQIALRLDRDTYLFTGGIKFLAEVDEEDFVVCDINTGGIGEIFSGRKDINAIIFGVTQDLVSVSERHTPLMTTLEDLAQLTGSELRVSSDTDPESIMKALADSGVCLIRGAGGIATGSNLKKAVAGIQILEKACEAEVHGRLLGGTVPIDADAADSYMMDFRTDYINRNEDEMVPFVGFEEDVFDLRVRLIEAGKDLVKQDLSYGSWGNLSVRCNDQEMLITPSSMDYFEIRPEDIVRMNIHDLVYGDQRMPSSESSMHAALYRKYPECNAVIHTHSNGVSVFAACEAGFTARNPEVRKVIGDVLLTAKAHPGTPELAAAVCEAMGNTHAAIIPHHGAVFTGPDLDTAFAIAEAVEIRARNILGFDVMPEIKETEEQK